METFLHNIDLVYCCGHHYEPSLNFQYRILVVARSYKFHAHLKGKAQPTAIRVCSNSVQQSGNDERQFIAWFIVAKSATQSFRRPHEANFPPCV